MSDGPLPGDWTPRQFVAHGGGSGFNRHTEAHAAVIRVFGRHDSWAEAFADLLELGLSDKEIWSGGWLAEWGNPEARRELRAILSEVRDRCKEPRTIGVDMTPDTIAATARDAAVAPGDLPGDLAWEHIQLTYHALAAAEPGRRNRRRQPDEPSRPEMAKALSVSISTLKRACVAAGKGPTWPPTGI